MSLEEYVKETLEWTAAATDLAVKAGADPRGYESTDSERWEFVFRMLTATSSVLVRLAQEIDGLATKLGEDRD